MKIQTSLIVLSLCSLSLVGCKSSIETHASAREKSGDYLSISITGDSKADLAILKERKAIEKEPTKSNGYNRLGQAFMQKGRESGEVENYVYAKDSFTKAVELAPKDSESLHNLAWSYTMFHEFRKAIELSTKAIEQDDIDPFAYGVLCDSYMEMGLYNEAVDAGQKMVDQRPDLSSLSRAAQLKWILGDAKGASFLMFRALRNGGPYAENTAWTQTQLGDMYWKQGAKLPARQQYEDVLKRMPKYKAASFGLARILASEGKKDEALAHFEVATDGNTPIPILTAYGAYLAKIGDKSKSDEIYARIPKIVEDHLNHNISGDGTLLSEYRMQRGIELKEALKDMETEASNHKTWQTYSGLAWAQHLNGDDATALKTIEKAIAIKVPEPDIYYRKAEILKGLGKKEESETVLGMAKNMNPDVDWLAR